MNQLERRALEAIASRMEGWCSSSQEVKDLAEAFKLVNDSIKQKKPPEAK